MAMQLMMDFESPIQEDVLNDFAKNISKISRTLSEADQRRVGDALVRLSDTAYEGTISSSHRTAACNALCGLALHIRSGPQGSKIIDGHRRSLCDSILAIYMDRYDGARQKSMEQCLSTLIKLLQTEDRSLDSKNITMSCVRRFCDILFNTHDRVKAKCSLHALTLFLSRGSIYYQDLLDECSKFITTPPGASALQSLFFQIFEWASYADAAPGAGQLSHALYKAYGAEAAQKSAARKQAPLWVAPLLKSIGRYPEMLRDFKNHVFPGLFMLNARSFWSFLQALHLDEHLGLINTNNQSSSHYEQILETDVERVVLFSALEVGKECAMVRQDDLDDPPGAAIQGECVVLPKSGLVYLLKSQSTEARLAGLTLTVLSKQPTKPFMSHELRLLRNNIPHLLMDTDQNFRSEFVSISQILVYRLRNIFASLRRIDCLQNLDISKNLSVSAGDSSPGEIWNRHVYFLAWWLDCLPKQLHPSASYQRHIAALKIMRVLLRSGLDPRVHDDGLAKRAKGDVKWPFQLHVVTAVGHRALMDLLLDAFDDVRQSALSLLKAIGSSERECLLPLTRAKKLLRQSGRVDFADGFARLIDLHATSHSPISRVTRFEEATDAPKHSLASSAKFDIIEKTISHVNEGLDVAQTSFTEAVEKHPIHGHLTALRYTLEGMNNEVLTAAATVRMSPILDSMLRCVERVWFCTQHVLCNDAPEGFVPDEAEFDPVLSTKDVLSYCWRSLKEARQVCTIVWLHFLTTYSLLLSASVTSRLVKNASASHDSWFQTLRFAGNLSFTQLASLRHRGAFSTVAQTFSVTCARCVGSADATTGTLLDSWLEKTLSLIHDQGNAVTRRSAGIPALLAGLCNADPTGPMLDRVVSELRLIAEQPAVSSTHLPQVHAMNSLKVLLMQPKLAETLQKYLVDCARLAANSITSPTWAIRNAGLILFRGIIDRLLGSNEKMEDVTKATVGAESRLSYERYPGLLELMEELLERSQSHLQITDHGQVSAITPEAVFPVLDLLRRAPPPPMYREKYQTLVLRATGSTHWHIRELSSRALAASICEQRMATILKDVLEMNEAPQNVLHGRLLCVKHSIHALTSADSQSRLEKLAAINETLIAQRTKIFACSRADAVRAAYWDCVISIMDSFVRLEIADRQYSPLAQALTSELVSIGRTLEEVPTNSALLRGALEINGWLEHLLCEKLRSSIPSQDRDIVTPLRKAITRPSQNIEVSSAAIDYMSDVVHESNTESKLAFVDALVGFAKSNSHMHFRCYSAMNPILLSLGSDKAASLMSSGPAADYLRTLNVEDDLQAELSPTQAQCLLLTQSFSLCAKLSGSHDPRLHDAELGGWINMVRISLREDSDYDLRKAAVESLVAFNSAPHYSILPTWLRDQLGLTIYDALHDDDSELRDIAAEATRRFCASTGPVSVSTARVAPVAAVSLIAKLISDSRESEYLFGRVFERTTNQHWDESRALTPPSEVLQQLLDHKATLFDVEKQNLYRDDAREAELWSSVLKRLTFKAMAPAKVAAFAKWAVDGVDTLIAQTQTGYDGPLGWTSKEEIFALGIRIICAANVVLDWRQKSRRVPIRGSELRRKLRLLADAGEAKALHPIWLQCIERTLAKSVTQRLQRMAVVLTTIEAGAIHGQPV